MSRNSKGSTRSSRRGKQPNGLSTRGNPFKGGLPRSISARLAYNTIVVPTQLNAGSPYSYYRWCPNDLYDPLYETGGGQSMFRDQLYALYHWGRVRSFKLKATVYSTSAQPFMVALIPKQDASASTYQVAAEQPGAKLGTVTMYKPLTLTVSANVDDFLHNKKGTWATDDSFKQPVGAALDTEASVNVHLYAYYPWGSGVADFTVQYTIEQDAVFSEVIAQSQS